ncbi:peptidoglycan DD-metalloendopeptidase family protein [uncultured Sphingomonas sp.]|uniref:murein hydrolase activator EnvC family protein n=1 Tax=uncultured Sphingomonas sp. TaxID=158754 RepID=UPI00261AE57A|nr:peptidoglycan DD-metalloendopeptidase family protein [uncultured Sphingomonas sp.]
MRGRGAMLGALAAMLLAAPVAAPAEDSLAVARARLAQARAAADEANKRAASLDRQAAAERDASARFRVEEQAVSARIARAEADLSAAQARVAIVARLRERQRDELARTQEPVARLLAALASLAGRPAIVAVAQPGSITDMVHLRAALATAVPAIDARTAAVRAGLAESRRLERAAALAETGLRDGRASLIAERGRLAALRDRHDSAASRFDHDSRAATDQAIAMGEEARDLVDRMTAISDERLTLATLARLPGPPVTDPAPAGPPAAYRLPAVGRLVTGLGEISDNGVRARGLTFAVPPAAALAAPAAGIVVFARSFRGYGGIVIINHGAGWSTLVTGFGTIAVKRGQALAAGQLLGRAGDGEEPRVTVELRRRDQPVDITALIG